MVIKWETQEQSAAMSETQSGQRDSGKRPRERIADMAESQSWQWVECDDVLAQGRGGTIRVTWPYPWPQRAGVGQSTRVTPSVHVPTGAVVFLPPGVDLGDVVASEK